MTSLQNAPDKTESLTVAGRTFSSQELDLVKQLIADYPQLSRHELAATACELLTWERPNGQLKTRECRDLLERIIQRDTLALPSLRPGRPRGSTTRTLTPAEQHPAAVIGPLSTLQPIQLVLVQSKSQREQWRAAVAQYHYLGERTPFGAHLRYLIEAGATGQSLGALQFSSPAWRMQARDQWIGWDNVTRERALQHIVNQSRFLILPWINVPHLASHILALSARRIRIDWHERYGVHPLLLESLVDEKRYRGTCYRAANWINVGRTTGRGRMDRHHQRHNQEPKQIFLYPLTSHAREQLAQGGLRG